MDYKIKKIFSPISYKRLFAYIGKYGFKGIWGKFKSGMQEGAPDLHYEKWFQRHKVTPEELERQKKEEFDFLPTISILVPTYNTPEKYLREMIDSVLAQSYENWQLCIADASSSEETRKILKSYVEKDKRICVKYLDENLGISDNTNEALYMAEGEYIGLLDHDDFVEPDLLYEVVKKLQDMNVDIVYTDEDKVSGKKLKHEDPNFKPDFSIDLFRSHNYITHFFVVDAEILNGIGGFRKEYDGSQDYDVMFRCIERVRERNHKIKHISKVLYHWRIHRSSTAGDPKSKMYCYEAGRKAVQSHLDRMKIKARVEHTDMWGMYHTIYETTGTPLLSIIIPNKDHADDLKKCIDSIVRVSNYKNYEFIIVENNSEEKGTFQAYEELEKKYPFVKVVYWDKEFNYSAINNFGVEYAAGDYILLLNNDTELISPDGISDMLGICMRNDVGVVGAKLLYEDDTVQHAGIVLGFGGFAGHVFNGIGKNDLGYMMRARINCNYSAVTGACLMTKKNVFKEVGGMTEEFKVGLNDVDYCLKVRDYGYLVVYDAFSLWHHYESKSRGYEDTPEKQKRFAGEIKLFQEKWGDVLEKGDPYYNKNFPVTVAPFTLD